MQNKAIVSKRKENSKIKDKSFICRKSCLKTQINAKERHSCKLSGSLLQSSYDKAVL